MIPEPTNYLTQRIMHKIFGLILSLFLVLPLSAQVKLGPITDNPIVRQAFQKKERQIIKEIEGFSGQAFQSLEKTEDCPEFLFGYTYVLQGNTATIFVDTVDLGGGPGSSITLKPCYPLQFGTANLDTTSLIYVSDATVDGGVDTVCVEFCNNAGVCEDFKYPIVVKRPGTTRIEDPVIVQAEEFLPEVCVDETVLPGTLNCNRFLDCPDDYDGDGRQTVYWTQYAIPTSCYRYVASRFAGTDTVCLVLCDEFTVCDTFKVPMVIQSDTLDLPFLDDFSYDGPYPRADFWLDRDAYVNYTMSANPPSIGMATLDGLDRGGRPYLVVGEADCLTSKYINLEGVGDDVFLKFFVSPKGYGLLPNEPDSLILQFRANNGQWVSIAEFDGIDVPVDSVPPFEFYSFPVNENRFKYNGFQFRFVNYVAPVGIYDLWHIDYVRLAENEGDDDTFQDVAFTQIPPPLLQNYTSMPWWHFEDFVNQEVRQEGYPSQFFNHTDQPLTPSANSAVLLQDLISGTSVPIDLNVTNGQTIQPKSRVDFFNEIDSDFLLDLTTSLEDDFTGAEEVLLEMKYQFQLNNQVLRNDTARYLNHFSNYFAYDDGSAESYIFFDNPQNDNPLLAVKFTTNVEDSLRGVRFHFPHVNGDAEAQLFNMYVWVDDLDSEPAYEAVFQSPLYASSKLDTLQGYTTYVLEDVLKRPTPVYLPAGSDFYIGFQQVTTTNDGIPIGFDFNNDFSEHIFMNTSGVWEPIPESFDGAVMIRAVVGDETPISTSTQEIVEAEEGASHLKLYPNPTDGIVYTDPTIETGCSYILFNHLGQSVTEGFDCREIQLSNFAPGVYYLQLQTESEGVFPIQKIILIR